MLSGIVLLSRGNVKTYASPEGGLLHQRKAGVGLMQNAHSVCLEGMLRSVSVEQEARVVEDGFSEVVNRC
jgi:hypothetical protein